MTEEKSIKILEHTKRNCGLPEQGNTWKPNAETIALDMGIQALEKQIAIKPDKVVNVFGENEYMCNECGNEIYRSIFYNYCPSCGQKIDWSEEE